MQKCFKTPSSTLGGLTLTQNNNKAYQQQILSTNNYKTKLDSKLELTRSEVQPLEHTIIESGKARVAGNINMSLILLD
jgi:hypothetical protein